MKLFSQAENFEMAKVRRDQINSLEYIISGWSRLTHLYQQVDLPEDKASKAIAELILVLKDYFPQLTSLNRIEAYDISNLGSKYFVGSMVVWQQGRIDHDQFRQFKIYSKVTPDDQFMIKEVLYRRFKHPEWQFPGLILVDGGKPQVSAATKLIDELEKLYNFKLSIIGLAKKQETIVIKTNIDWVEINLPKNSPALQLLQQLRDEAHRFANHYRRQLIRRSTLS